MSYNDDGKIIKTCLVCEREFKPRQNNQLYCSGLCNPRYKKIGGYSETRLCDNCGMAFEAVNSRQRFCSARCSESAYLIGYLIIFERDKFSCLYCGASSITHHVKLTVDHIVPISNGGTDIAENLVTACNDCNIQKHDKVMSKTNIDKLLEYTRNENKRCNIENDQRIKLFKSAPERRKKLKGNRSK